MQRIRSELERERKRAVERLHRLGGVVALEEDLGAPIAGAGREEADEVQANEHREMGMASRVRLVERVNQLTAALARLSDGTYGICEECGEPIQPARLKAIPEVGTCLGCQELRERRRSRD